MTRSVSPVFHTAVEYVTMTSVPGLPDQSVFCLASDSGSSVPTHYHRDLALPRGLLGTLVSVKSDHGNKVAFPKSAKPGHGINRT